MTEAHQRNIARARPDEAMTAGFVHLPEDAQQRRLQLWATISRDEPMPPPGAPRFEPGVRIVKEHEAAAWLREHGKGIPGG